LDTALHVFTAGNKHGFRDGFYEDRVIPRQTRQLTNESLGFRFGGAAFTAFLA
jgi:hypothetical protein